MGLPVAAWAAATNYLLGQYVTNGGNTYQCVQAGASAGAGGPTGAGAKIVDNTCLWDYVSSSAITGWDVSTAVAAGSNNEIQPSAAIAVTGFGTNSQVPAPLLNYLLMQVDRLLLWLTNMLSYPLTWTGIQTFSGGVKVPDGSSAPSIAAGTATGIGAQAFTAGKACSLNSFSVSAQATSATVVAGSIAVITLPVSLSKLGNPVLSWAAGSGAGAIPNVECDAISDNQIAIFTGGGSGVTTGLTNTWNVILVG